MLLIIPPRNLTYINEEMSHKFVSVLLTVLYYIRYQHVQQGEGGEVAGTVQEHGSVLGCEEVPHFVEEVRVFGGEVLQKFAYLVERYRV